MTAQFDELRDRLVLAGFDALRDGERIPLRIVAEIFEAR